MRPALHRRGTRLALAACAVTLVFAGGWLTAAMVQSPSQREALAAPPSPGLITVNVQRGDLTETTTVQALAKRESTVATVLTAPASASRAVVTTVLIDPGTSAAAFAPVVAVNDRPVFLVPGRLAPYRDLVEGDRGSDVTQLQVALRLAGYDIPAEEDVLGRETRAALLSAYVDAGYWPVVETATGSAPTAPSNIDSSARVTVPMNELAVADLEFPVAVDAVPAIGADVMSGSAILTVSSGNYIASADIPDGILARMTVGLPGTLGSFTDTPIDVVVKTVNPGDPVGGVAGSITLAPVDGQVIPDAWYGEETVATVTIESVAHDALIVPSRAVSTDASGLESVQRVGSDGSQIETVPVKVIGELNGLAAITPDTVPLEAGDVVVIE